MATVNIQYGTQSGVPFTMANLASDNALITGRQSAIIDNTSTLFPDYLVSAKITTGQAPQPSSIELWVVPLIAITGNAVNVWPDSFGVADAGVSVSSLNTKYNALGMGTVLNVDTFPNRSYMVKPFSVASRFDGICPEKFSLFITHNTGANLSPTGTLNQLWVTPVTNTVV